MKRSLLAFLAVFIAASSASAQTAKEKPPPTASIRVAVVNVGFVFNHCGSHGSWGPRHYELQIEGLVEARSKAKYLMDEMEKWADELRANPAMIADQRKAREEAIYENEKKLKEMNAEVSKLMAKRSEDHLVLLWKEMQDGIRSYAIENNFNVVLGYGDVTEKCLLDDFRNVDRKMQAMDAGSTVPLFVSRKADISEAIVDQLSKRRYELQKASDTSAMPESVSKEKPLAVGATRVAVIDIARVWNVAHPWGWWREGTPSREGSLESRKKELKDLLDELEKWAAAIRESDLPAGRKEGLAKLVNAGERKLQDAKRKLSEDQLVAMWKSIQEAIRLYASENNIDIVLAYGEPSEKELLNAFPNVHRKVQTADTGGTIPAFVTPGSDITEAVGELMNKLRREGRTP